MSLIDMTNVVTDAAMKYQGALEIHDNKTSVCVAVEPMSDEAAIALGVNAGDVYVGTRGNSDGSYTRRVGRRYFPLDDVARELVSRKRESGSRQLRDVTDGDLQACGSCISCAICLSPKSGEIAAPIWARVYISVCDLASTRAYARHAAYAGFKALKRYANSRKDSKYICP